ncbi:MAG: hypothetical protein HKM95_13940 [Inquilinus sp.]|nr:hypothetical protein [Inquilinus sp.]
MAERFPTRSGAGPALALAATLLLLSSPAYADDEDRRPRSHEESVAEALDLLNRTLRDLEIIVEELPRYGLPEITADGDIIIPRLPRDEHPRRGGDDDEDDDDEALDL